MKVSDLIIYIMKIISEIYKKALKVQMKLLLDRWWENGLVFTIARTKIQQNFLATKYDIKQHSDATLE